MTGDDRPSRAWAGRRHPRDIGHWLPGRPAIHGVSMTTTAAPPLHPLARPLLALAGGTFLVTTIVWAIGFAEYPDNGVSGADFSPAADAQNPGMIAGGWLAMAGCLVLLVAIAGLSTHQGPLGRWLPRYATILGLVGAAAGAGSLFSYVVYERYFASLAPAVWDAAYGHYPPSYAIASRGSLGVFALGLGALGIGARRARLISRSAAVVLVLGALAIPSVGPVAIGLAGIGLILAARRPRRAVPSVSETADSAAPVSS